MAVQKPTMCVVAGPNGSGKTTTTELLYRTADGVVVKRYTDDIPEWAQILL